MRVLVINLDRAPERLAHTTRVFAAAGVPFERLSATDGQKLTAEEIARWRQGTPHFGEMRAAELSCYLSHRRCWEVAAANDEPIVVFEDDQHLGRNVAPVLASANWVPADADVVKLEANPRPLTLDRAVSATIAGREVHRNRGLNTGGGAYVLTAKGARLLLANLTAIASPFDHLLFNPRMPLFERVVTYQLVPALCIQDSVRYADGAGMTLTSYIAPERPSHQRQGSAEFLRKISRPFENAVRNTRTAVANFTHGRRVVRVAFA